MRSKASRWLLARGRSCEEDFRAALTIVILFGVTDQADLRFHPHVGKVLRQQDTVLETVVAEEQL